MTASCLSTPLSRPLLPRPARQRRHSSTALCSQHRVLAIVGAVLVGAALLVPEQPAAQADICQRHNGVAACRVW
jgi:hypothetical protein